MISGGERGWLPYCGAAPTPDDLWLRWNFDPVLLVAIAACGAALWNLARTPSERRVVAGSAALVLVLFVSPFCALSSALFAARVAHHVLLAAILAPMLALASPAARFRLPGSVGLWTALQALTFWAWHSPALYAAALSSDAVYWAMQISLTGTAFGFWSALRRAPAPQTVAALLFSTVQMGLLGALITFAANPLYAPHLYSTFAWGLEPLADQQLAGLIMWVPSAGLYLAAALVAAHRWLAREEREFAR